jgi:BirA family transcriptional regulator, biotin operon repressor / biotin---[acetyl-CoA-carboxylase] ligase
MSPDATLLRILRPADRHLTVGELAAQLGLSMIDVNAAIARLREAGFDIEAHPQFGCRLLASPDRLIADDLHARLERACALAREILVLEETASTNDVASKLGRERHPGGVAIFAERQTAGRGRFGRKWDSAERAGLWMSLLLRPAWPMARWPRLTTWAGVCVAEAIERLTELRAQIKWPNDVLVHGKKVAGILIETATDLSGAPFVVVGIGVNINQIEFPPELAARAGSLRQLTGKEHDRAALAAALLERLEDWLPRAGAGGELIGEARRRSSLLGTWVRLQAGQSVAEGTAEDLDEEGNLLIRVGDGTLQRATAGEVAVSAVE